MMCIDTIKVYVKSGEFKVLKSIDFNEVTRQYARGSHVTQISSLNLNRSGQIVQKKDSVVNLTISNGIAYITYHPMMILHGHNRDLPSYEDFILATYNVSKMIEPYLQVDIVRDAKVCRLDIAKDISPQYSFETYFALFTAISGNRGVKSMNWETTYQWGSKYIQLIFYDKHKQLKEVKNMAYSGNRMRTELRLKRATHVQKKTGIHLLKEALTQAPFENLETVLRETIKKMILAKDISHRPGIGYSPRELLLKLVNSTEKKKRTSISDWYSIIGLPFLMKDVGGIDGILAILREANYEKSTLSRQTKELKKNLKFLEPVSLQLLHQILFPLCTTRS